MRRVSERGTSLARGGLLFRERLVDKAGQPRAALHRFVELEAQLRSDARPDALAQRRAQKSGGGAGCMARSCSSALGSRGSVEVCVGEVLNERDA